jgi:hypothetical protein
MQKVLFKYSHDEIYSFILLSHNTICEIYINIIHLSEYL